MGWRIEQECPQCGAAIELDEADHILVCPFCNTRNVLCSNDVFRYILPHKATDRPLFYAPYHRFKGNIFFCQGQTVGNRIIDITQLAGPYTGLNHTLGLRPQAMTLHFADPATPGTFLHAETGQQQLTNKIDRYQGLPPLNQLLHRAFIGETVSLIYLPLSADEDTLYDQILDSPICKLSDKTAFIDSERDQSSNWQISFLPCLCPQCGWELNGEHDSIILGCKNCDTAWQIAGNGLGNIAFHFIAGANPADYVYLPFWRITAASQGIEIDTYADFMRITNQPKAIADHWHRQQMHYWSPAFKIRPKEFLRLAGQLTIAQGTTTDDSSLPLPPLRHPITLPVSEAIQALTVILAHCVISKKNIFPQLPAVSFKVTDTRLFFLPFRRTGRGLYQETMHINIDGNTLQFGRNL